MLRLPVQSLEHFLNIQGMFCYARGHGAAGRCLSSSILIKRHIFSSAFVKFFSIMQEISLNGESGSFSVDFG